MRSAYRTTRRLRRRLPPVTTSKTVSTGGRRCGRLELANGPPVPPRARARTAGPRAGGGLVYTMRSRRRPAHAFSAHRSPQPRSPGSAATSTAYFINRRGDLGEGGTCGELNLQFYSGIGFDFRDGLFRFRDSVRTPATSPDRPGDGVLPTRPLSAIDMRTRQLRTTTYAGRARRRVARPSTSGGGGAPGAGARPARAARRAARTPAADGAAAGREASIRPYTATA